jgi:predicted RNA-binding Zn ribbon-like protein
MEVKKSTISGVRGSVDQLAMADPRLAVELLSTLRHQGDDLVDMLAEPHHARVWLREHLGGEVTTGRLSEADLAQVVRLRNQLRELFTAVVDQRALPAKAIATLNRAAAGAPVTLAAQQAANGSLRIRRVSPTGGVPAVCAELARAALALLTDDLRGRLRLCRAPRCVLFFLAEHPRQQWCSPGCGNRARVARHQARQRAARLGDSGSDREP